MRIAIDAMGGDNGVNATLPACIDFLKLYSDVELTLVGNQDIINKYIKKYSYKDRINIIHTNEVISMEDSIEIAMRKKRQSSMRIAIEQVKQKSAVVCVSSGNTGALMALSHYLLKTIDGIDRPAIATFLPNQKNLGTIVLDLGANADCEAKHLLQFAYMGKVMAKSVAHIENPSIGLLNIGEEAIKGNEVAKQACTLLKEEKNLNFYGNVEGNDIFKGTTDIVVCDGFMGNIALKSAEGAAKMISNIIKQSFTQNIFTKLMGFISSPVLKNIKNKADHRRYNGAMLLGLNGLVIKSHGSADSFAFLHALKYAYEASKHNMTQHMQETFNKKI